MRIHEFEAEERLLEIKKNHLQVNQIKESLAEYREKYRNLSREIQIEQDSLFQCCDFFERSLLINCYTFSEQLVKNFVYEILEKDRHDNIFLNRFIENKIPKNKFSPNVSYSSIGKLVSEELCQQYKFSLKSNNNCFRVYDEMVKSRHKYAHNGIYDFDFNNFGIVIQVLEFLYSELKMPLEEDMEYRQNYQNLISQIEELTKSIYKAVKSKDIESLDVRVYGTKLTHLKTCCSLFTSKYYESLNNVKLLSPILEKVRDLSNSDLRSKKEFVRKVVDLNSLI